MSAVESSVRPINSHPAASSLWVATAPAAATTPPLTESTTTDVLVIGAGYTGLSTALHLADSGASVCVLDAHEPGWGASGRNGGQVNPTLKHDPDELIRLFGPERGEALIEAVSSSADVVFDLISRYAIDCAPVRAGWLQVGYEDAAVVGMHTRARQWEKRGVRVKMLDRAALARRMGSSLFAGGWLDGRAGGVQPLAYVRGLARAALGLGIRVHGQTPVTRLERHDGYWVATTAGGLQIKATQVVLGTNGYTDGLWPGLARTVLAANSFIIATRPLGARGDGILDRGETGSTSQRLLLYFRKDAHGRLLMGGRGHFPDPRGAQDFAHLERSLALMFPQLGRPEIEYRWAGRIAVTRDFMPHLHQPAPGITMALGYNGRGIAMATCLGKHVAALVSGTQGAPSCPFPISPIQPIPMHGLQRFYVAAGVAWYSLLDRLGK